MSDRPQPSGRVVVTGVGAVTPLGTGVEKFWPRMLAGESGVGRVTRFDPSEHASQVAAEVDDFVPEDWLDKKEARRLEGFISFAVASATMALRDSKLELDDELRNNVGVLIGSGIGGLTFLVEQHIRQLEFGVSKVSPFVVPFMIADMAAGYVSITHDLRGPNSCVVTACSTGANAVGDAYHMIKRGDAVAMLAGGVEACINNFGMAAFSAARAMSTRNDDPSRASRPFDATRDGFVMGEGGGILVLEDYDHAKARGARIYGELVGYGMSGDAYHITQPHPEGYGAIRALRMAIRQADIDPSQIGYVNAHGTSTPLNDKIETHAIKEVFSEAAYQVPISSTKSMIGHTLGAAGAIEAIVCLLAMRDGKLPPTINYENPDPDCDLDYIPNQARDGSPEYTMSNSYGFGGHNVTLIFKKVD